MQLIKGNTGDRATLEPAVDGAQGVYAVTDFLRNGIEGEIAQGKLIADVSKSAGVRHFIFASAASADRNTGIPHFDSKWQIEHHIERLGLPATILRPTIFMEDLTDARYFPVIGWGMMTRIIGTRQPVRWIAVEDIGIVAAAAFANPDGFIGRKVGLAGDTLSIAEARAVFKSVDGKSPFSLFMPIWFFRRMVSKDLLTMWYWLHDHTLEADVEATRKIHPGVMRMETWLRQTRGRKA